MIQITYEPELAPLAFILHIEQFLLHEWHKREEAYIFRYTLGMRT